MSTITPEHYKEFVNSRLSKFAVIDNGTMGDLGLLLAPNAESRYLDSFCKKADEIKREIFYTKEVNLSEIALQHFGQGDEMRTRLDAVHGFLGVLSEMVELRDAVRGFIPSPSGVAQRVNLIEECGDVLFYLQAILLSMNSSLGDAMEANRDKLLKRYPKEFSAENALNRDTSAEFAAMEQTIGHSDG